MTQCQGCSVKFPCLDVSQCGKCLKKDKAGSSADRDIIDKQPQCLGCGIVYSYLQKALCGACDVRSETEPDLFEGYPQITNLLTRIKRFDGEVSKHRLNQRAQNPGLQSAAKVKERLSTLKKQNKHDGIDISVQLWIYPPTGGTAKKAQLPPIPAHFDGGESADHMFDEILKKVELGYDRCPAYKTLSTEMRPVFNRVKVVFGVTKGATYNTIADPYFCGTAGELFGLLKSNNLLSESDAKNHKVSVRLFVYSRDSICIESSDSDTGNDPKIITKSAAMARKSSMSKLSKRKSGIAFGADASPPRASSSRTSRSQPSSKSRVLSHFRSLSSRPQYISAYRRDVPTITYTSYQILQTKCETNASGVACFVQSGDAKTILIGQNWQSHVKGGKPAGAYLSKGFTKYAFRGRIDTQDLAIFQCQPVRGYTEDLNSRDLRDELLLLGQAQYFLDTFYQRAKSLEIEDIPHIRWNFAGSFIGQAVGVASPPDTGATDDRSLIFSDFLAMPLLDLGGDTEERKFSGNEEIAHNIDPLGRVIDAFVHHALVDSFGDILFVDVQGVVFEDGGLCLFDPQAHTSVFTIKYVHSTS
ncbi:hypothetical protein BJV77DRAFT_513913 [Russula vinacea]|nr:hypothetical protein BJV77DRAFT_513913 [Russula vinacea]